jgi:inositol 1,4,5-triphosphate receptor type 1/inositol 1,4,5-triphosphate receptor type 3
MLHEEFMKRFYYKYPIVGFLANYIQLWKDIAYYLTIVLNVIIIGSFALDSENKE